MNMLARGWEKRAHWILGLLIALALLIPCAGFASEQAATGGGHDAHVASTDGGHDAHGDAGAHGGHGVTHSQVMSFIWHCLNFSILLVVLVKYLRKPISEGLKGRTESIKASFDELESKKREAERQYAEYEKRISSLDAEAERILKSFAEQGEAEKARIVAQAQESADRIRAQAQLYVEQEIAKARIHLQQEVADMAVKMAEDLVRKNINEQDHHRLINEYLERVVSRN